VELREQDLSRNMRIAVLLDEQFPNGMASANRAFLYTKGLTELGNDTIILVPRATERHGKIRNPSTEGIHDGVIYRYAYESVIRKSFSGRRLQNSISLLNSFLFFLRFKPDIIIIAANNFKYILLGKFCAILTNARLVREKSEVPYYRIEKLSARNKMKIKAEFRLFDGMIAISGALKDFFQKDLGLKLKIIEVPILIDCNTMPSVKNGHGSKKTNLVYTGSLLDHKDGVITIIKAFARILKDHPDLKLVMTGDLNGSVSKTAILNLIDNLELKGKVELPGYLAREKLNELTSSAAALLLAKPVNRQNRYNMATKIGEYLLTGRPAVISSVDPVCGYLKHRESACMTDPDEILMAEEIQFLLDNEARADAIGMAGRHSVQKLFDYKIHASRINDFFRELLKTQ
jgi:glycosyltransferase involved in cell wall biosynthesis